MNPIIVELDEITSSITPGELLLLKAIYTGNKKAFEKLSNEYGNYIPNVLESLQNKLYIKIQGDSFEELVCREKANILFGAGDVTFEEFWKRYHKITRLKSTDKAEALKFWKRLKKDEVKLAINNIKDYFQSTCNSSGIYYPRKAKYYLEYKLFNDEFKSTSEVSRVIAM